MLLKQGLFMLWMLSPEISEPGKAGKTAILLEVCCLALLQGLQLVCCAGITRYPLDDLKKWLQPPAQSDSAVR